MKIGYLRRLIRETPEQSEAQVQRLKDAGCEKVIVMGNDISPQENFPLDQVKDFFNSGDSLVTIRLSRLCLGLKQLTEFCDWLEKQNITLVTLDEGISTKENSTPNFYDILKAIISFKSEVQREKTLFGLSRARARGRKGGRPKGISQKALQKATLAARLYNESELSIQEICTQLGISKPTLYRYLKLKGIKIWKN